MVTPLKTLMGFSVHLNVQLKIIFEKNIKQEDYNAENLFFNKRYILSFVRIKYQKFFYCLCLW
ncbi:hypothetical protein EFM26_09250 [Limosilactobacillus fermentum]|nr:hypothetical protein [Limosilactobacillus fermentum]